MLLLPEGTLVITIITVISIINPSHRHNTRSVRLKKVRGLVYHHVMTVMTHARKFYETSLGSKAFLHLVVARCRSQQHPKKHFLKVQSFHMCKNSEMMTSR